MILNELSNLFFQTACMTSSRLSKIRLHAVKIKAQIYFQNVQQTLKYCKHILLPLRFYPQFFLEFAHHEEKIPTRTKNTQKTNIINNMQFVSCDQYSKSCVQFTKMIIKDCEL